MNVLGLITARGGSKGLPGKHLRTCGGRPLLAWTCEAARQASSLTRIILSTDDVSIAAMGRELGVEVPFMRPPELATDTARSIAVAEHAVEWLSANDGWSTDVLVLLQPTSPLRTSRHIDEAFAALASDVDSVVSVMNLPHGFAPWSIYTLDGKYLRDYETRELPFDRSRRQDQPELLARNGPAVVVTRASVLATGRFYGDRLVPYLMATRESVDIDTAEDLALADWLLRGRTDLS